MSQFKNHDKQELIKEVSFEVVTLLARGLSFDVALATALRKYQDDESTYAMLKDFLVKAFQAPKSEAATAPSKTPKSTAPSVVQTTSANAQSEYHDLMKSLTNRSGKSVLDSIITKYQDNTVAKTAEETADISKKASEQPVEDISKPTSTAASNLAALADAVQASTNTIKYGASFKNHVVNTEKLQDGYQKYTGQPGSKANRSVLDSIISMFQTNEQVSEQAEDTAKLTSSSNKQNLILAGSKDSPTPLPIPCAQPRLLTCLPFFAEVLETKEAAGDIISLFEASPAHANELAGLPTSKILSAAKQLIIPFINMPETLETAAADNFSSNSD